MKLGPKPNGFITSWPGWIFWTLFLGAGSLFGILLLLSIAVPQINALLDNPPLDLSITFGVLLTGPGIVGLILHWSN